MTETFAPVSILKLTSPFPTGRLTLHGSSLSTVSRLPRKYAGSQTFLTSLTLWAERHTTLKWLALPQLWHTLPWAGHGLPLTCWSRPHLVHLRWPPWWCCPLELTWWLPVFPRWPPDPPRWPPVPSWWSPGLLRYTTACPAVTPVHGIHTVCSSLSLLLDLRQNRLSLPC